jgi:hypothetical protein
VASLVTPQLAHWSCNDDGEAAIKDGFCDAEQGRFASCIQRSGAEPARKLQRL